MSTTVNQDRIIPVEAIGKTGGEPPVFLPPDPATEFLRRAERFARLAPGHALGDWLAFLGELSRAQHDALQELPPLALPEATALERARQHAMPPLATATLPRPPVWRAVLRRLIDAAGPRAPAAAQASLAALRGADDAALEALAARALALEPLPDPVAQPFVGAALQVIWTRLAADLARQGPPAPGEVLGLCPCCGTPAVASIVRTDPGTGGRRYLHCALCQSEWHVVRARCTACDSNDEVGFQMIEGGSRAVRAETCAHCRGYLKIAYTEEDAGVDPVADDLATLALDLLVFDAGYQRTGPNLLLAAGE